MSFPTLQKTADVSLLSPEEQLEALANAWKTDCSLAYRRLREAYRKGVCAGAYDLHQDPDLHMQMLRTFAASAIRESVLPYLFPKMKFDFINCCSDIGRDTSRPLSKEDIVTLQIQFQNGEKAYADC